MRLHLSICLLIIAIVTALPAFAATKPSSSQAAQALTEDKAEAPAAEAQDIMKDLKPVVGPTTVSLGSQGRITVPQGFAFLNGKDTQTILKRMENFPSGDEVGMLFPTDLEWFTVYSYEATGYVEDKGDNATIDDKAILQSFKEGVAETNKERTKRGWATSEVMGWSVKPHYDSTSKNLEWGLRFSSEGRENINYHVRVLGREGVMKVVLVDGPEHWNTSLTETRKLLAGYQFVQGKTYAEFRQGDKLAGYGVAALIGGGVAAAAVKSGLLGKFLKPILAGIVAAGGAVVSFFRRKKS